LFGLTVKIPRNLRRKSVKPAIMRSNQRMKVARRAQHCVQTVAVCAFEVAAIHPVVCFQVADDRLNDLLDLLDLLAQCVAFIGVIATRAPELIDAASV
jgi:hypothetical protein